MTTVFAHVGKPDAEKIKKAKSARVLTASLRDLEGYTREEIEKLALEQRKAKHPLVKVVLFDPGKGTHTVRDTYRRIRFFKTEWQAVKSIQKHNPDLEIDIRNFGLYVPERFQPLISGLDLLAKHLLGEEMTDFEQHDLEDLERFFRGEEMLGPADLRAHVEEMKALEEKLLEEPISYRDRPKGYASPADEDEKRQRKAETAKRVAAQRAAKTRKKILDAVIELRKIGCKPTLNEIMQKTGVSRSTASEHTQALKKSGQI